MFIGVNDQHSLNLCQKQHHFVVYWLMVFLASCPCLFSWAPWQGSPCLGLVSHVLLSSGSAPHAAGAHSEHGCGFVSCCCPLAPQEICLQEVSSHSSACSALWCSCSPEQKMALHWGHPFTWLCWVRRASLLSHDHGSKYLEDFFFCHRFLWSLCQANASFPTPAMVEFHSSDSGDTLNILGTTRSWQRGFSTIWRT